MRVVWEILKAGLLAGYGGRFGGGPKTPEQDVDDLSKKIRGKWEKFTDVLQLGGVCSGNLVRATIFSHVEDS